VTLTNDSRQLYQWHDGQSVRFVNCFASGIDFIPLQDVLQSRGLFNKDDNSPRISEFDDALALRKDWLEIFPNGSGDGYFFDLGRKPEEGAVFYMVHDDFSWMFYPSLKNLFAAIADCYETGAYPWDFSSPDVETMDDSIHSKYGRSAEEPVLK